MSVDRLTPREAAAAAGVSRLSARKLFRALGYADADDEPVLGETELQVLRIATRLVRDGTLDERTVLDLARAVGRSVDRLATWQVETLAERVGGDPATTHLLLRQVSPDLEELLGLVWRRLADDAVERVLVPAGEVFSRAVGFADVVGWTQMVSTLDEPELAALVRRFGDVAGDAVADHGGRVIKTVGDEVMFSSGSAEDAARTALTLSRAFEEDPFVPGVRVGFAYGQVVARLGDLFGTTVNLASRVSRLAGAGDVLTDARTAGMLTGTTGLRLRTLGPRQVRGVGPVALVSVETPGQRTGEGGYAPGEHG
ncbi:adenylate/guanylate cyclase domain-containing protein [Aquipuribacter hungaricus]|uniref:Adenylate/guanylate cyclase domain-containing protein n=1 Tax=Aquipuribacter hungaricus TaxID=545624 RepID=A0ABV7WIT6_9MICO